MSKDGWTTAGSSAKSKKKKGAWVVYSSCALARLPNLLVPHQFFEKTKEYRRVEYL